MVKNQKLSQLEAKQKIACKIEWFEIPAPDLKKAREFYSILFHWEIVDYSAEYLLFKSGNINGGLNGKRIPCENGFIFSITVDDISETLKNVDLAGGKVIEDKYNIGNNLGFSASFKDPNGNHIELWSEH